VLFIIEAYGKIASLKKTLSHLGHDAEVISTLGHLKSFSSSLWPIGVDKNMNPVGLSYKKPEVVERLKTAIASHHEIIIATDPDSEGHYIANDVLALCGDKHKVSRIQFYGMDKESVEYGLNRAVPVDTSLSKEASRRLVMDRVICSSLSDKEAGVYAGRVLTPTVAHVSKTKQATLLIEKGTPFNGVELVYHASAMMGKSPTEVVAILQGSYEKGRMSYFRSDSHRVGQGAKLNVGKIFSIGLSENIADTGAHPAPYPIAHGSHPVDINMPVECMSDEDAVLSVMNRQWIKGHHEVGSYDKNLAHHVIESLVSQGLGRPSTIPFMADKINMNGCLDRNAGLTEKGRTWLGAAEMLIPPESQRVMSSCISGEISFLECFEKLGLADKVDSKLEASVSEDFDMGFNH